MRTGNAIKSLVEFQLDLPKNDPEFIRHSNKDGEAFFHTEYGFIHLSTVSTQEFYCKELCEFSIIIKLIWVRPSDRNRGLGRKLLRKLIEIYEHTNVVLMLFCCPVEQVGTTIPPDSRVVDDVKLQRKLVDFYHSEGFEVAKYESVYIPFFLMEMVKRQSWHRVTPILMTRPAKMVPDVVRKELEDIKLDKKIWSETYLREDERKEDFNPFEYMSGEFLL